MTERLALIAALGLLLAPTAAEARKLPPRDLCTTDASFTAFRTTLRGIVKRKDTKALLAITAPDIAWTFSGDSGRASFAKSWQLEQGGATSGVWGVLENLLATGCSLKDGQAMLPYWYEHGPDGEVAEVGVINGQRVNLRAAPSLSAQVLRSMDWEVVAILDSNTDRWTRVRLGDGTEGYVLNDYLWTGTSYRAFFERKSGKWTMTWMIAGD